jgi:CelD/BcsL family acetyltransferase involved in cellulose biosynthesis
VRVEVHDELSPDLARAWAEVFARDTEATPFSSPGWARAWLSAWRDDPGRPLILTFEDGGELAGLAPLVIRDRGPFRVLNTLGQPPADYWDVVARDDARADVLAAFTGWLGSSPRRWDVLSLTCLREESATEQALEARGLRVSRRQPVPCPGIELPGSFEEYLGRFPSRRRKNMKRHLRKLDEDGEIELRQVTDPAELPGVVDRWQQIRVRQWAERGPEDINPMHAREDFRGMMLAATTELLPSGLAVVWEFSHEGRTAGVWINFADRRALYIFLGGFEPDLYQLGIGKIATLHGIRWSIETGRSFFDFMQGDEPYKYWYDAEDRLTPRLVVGHGGVRSRAGHALARRRST